MRGDQTARTRNRLTEINDLDSANALLSWDQQVNMPPGGAAARGRQTGDAGPALARKVHRCGDRKLLDDLRAYEASLPYDSDEASLIRVTRRNYERATRFPAFMAQFYQHSAAIYEAWAKARPANDFRAVQPLLKDARPEPPACQLLSRYEHIADR